jgi:hypothetical protein
MTGRLAGLLAAQLLYLAIGTGLLPLLRVASTRAELLRRLGLGYMVGLAAAGALAAELALLDVPIGLVELSVLAAISLALGARRLRRAPGETRPWRPRHLWEWLSPGLGAAASVALLVLMAHASRAYAVRPLKEWDGWAIWGLKARALYEFGGTYSPVFTTYQPVAHPIFLPAVEAIGFRAMGAYDATLIHVQLIALAFGFAAALWALLADRVAGGLIAIALLALLSASPVLEQLSTNLADVPLAFLCALGVVSLARFILTGERWTLVTAALFLGSAMLTKSEGLLFAVAAFVAAAAVLAPWRDWRRLGHLALAALGAAAILLPWRIYLAAHDLRNPEYALSDVFRPSYLADRSARVSPAASRLWDELSSSDWGLLVPLALVAIFCALLAARYRIAAFALLWPALAFLGLVLVYWISVVPIELTLTWTAGRVVVSLVVTSVALAPLLAGEAWRALVSVSAGGAGTQ